MNYNILIVIVVAMFSIVLAAVAKEFCRAFQVTEGYAVLLKNGNAGSPEHKPEEGAS